MPDDRIVMTVPTTEVITDLARVDADLSTLYRRAAGAEGPGGPIPVVRAQLFNLVVYSRTEQETEEAALNVAEVSGTHPCRAIIVECTDPRPDEPAAVVSAVCGITQRGDRRLCGEIIRLHVADGSQMVGSVMPLLVGDVPVFLWTPGDIPVNDAAFDDLFASVDNVIFDSRRFAELGAELERMGGFCPAGGADCRPCDLCWTSLQLWRELTAQHFDPPAARHYLDRFDEVTVRFASDDRQSLPSAPLLFVSWLVQRLDIEIRGTSREDEELVLNAKQAGRDVTIRLIPEVDGDTPGALHSVVIRCSDEHSTANFATRGVSAKEISVSEDCAGVCLPPHILELPPQGQAALASQTLYSLRRDRIYDEVVVIARAILSML